MKEAFRNLRNMKLPEMCDDPNINTDTSQGNTSAENWISLSLQGVWSREGVFSLKR